MENRRKQSFCDSKQELSKKTLFLEYLKVTNYHSDLLFAKTCVKSQKTVKITIAENHKI